jgi:hypothetical protein
MKPPIIRNLEIYHQIVCENKTQAQIAAEFGISQPRVAAVRQIVHRWVEATVSPGIELAQSQPAAAKLRFDSGQKLHLAITLRRLEMNQACGKFLDGFGGSEVAIAFIPLLRLWDHGAIPQTLTALLPARETIRSAIRIAGELDDLARLAERGPYPHLHDELLRAQGHPSQPSQPSSAPALSAAAASPEPALIQ